MRFLAIVLNIVFLFSCAAGQATCLCSESDECQGLANPFTLKKLAEIHSEFEKRNLLSELPEDKNSAADMPSFALSEEKDDCCAECFSAADITNNFSSDVYDSLIDHAQKQASFYTAGFHDCRTNEQRLTRAPPPLTQPGTKTYLNKRTLLI